VSPDLDALGLIVFQQHGAGSQPVLRLILLTMSCRVSPKMSQKMSPAKNEPRVSVNQGDSVRPKTHTGAGSECSVPICYGHN